MTENLIFREVQIDDCDEMLLNRDIDRESHQRMITKLKFDIPGKTAFSRRKLSNHPIERGTCAYPTEKQGVRK